MTNEQDVKVYFGNLPFALTEQSLAAFAAVAGTIVSAEIIKYGQRSKGFGFVTFTTKEEASAAIDMLNDKELDGRPILVKISKPKTESAPRPPRKPKAEKRIDEDSEEVATLVPASAETKAPASEKPRGRSRKPRAPKAAEGETPAAPAKTEEKAPRPKRPAQPKIDTSLNTSLYVANLPYKVRDADLFEIFKDFAVKNAYVVKNFGRSKGFGFVELESTAERDRVLAEVTNAIVNDREIVIKPATAKAPENGAVAA